MKLKILFMLLSLLNAIAVISQGQVIKGLVKDEDGKPIDAATINIKGTKISVAANTQGAFSISAPSTAKTLVVSSIGYLPAEQAITVTDLNLEVKRD